MRTLRHVVALLAFATACSSDGPTVTKPDPTRDGIVAHVTLVGLPASLAAGDIAVFIVRAQDANGHDVLGHTVTLASSNTPVALIDASGRVRAVSHGTATISATVDGIVGTMPVTVADLPAEFALTRSDGSQLPELAEADSVDLHGSVGYREIYLERGTLELTGGAEPRYQTLLHYGFYDVTTDAAGYRHLTQLNMLDFRDHGTVTYDANGDLTLHSDLNTQLAHDASATSDGFSMHYHFDNSVSAPLALFFQREPR